LLESLVALFLIGVLLGLLLPAISMVRERANQLACRNNLKDLALAVHHHHMEKGVMPPYATGKMNEIYGGRYVHLLAYEGYENVDTLLSQGQRSQHHGLRVASDGRYLPGVHNAFFPNLVCPSDPTRALAGDEGLTNYLANWYVLTDDHQGFYRPAQSFNHISDGLSNTVLFAEGYSRCDGLPRLALYSAVFHNFGVTQAGLPSDSPRLAPADYTMFQVQPPHCDKLRSQTPHRVMNAALADGSSRSIAADITPATWKELLKPQDGTPNAGEW
jgi:hypothetical protein